MTEKQKRFCDEYLIDCNATRAAIRAGYAESTASNACYWINWEADQRQVRAGRKSQYKPEVAEYIAEQLAQMHNKNTADAQEVVEYLTSVLRGESRSSVLAFVGEGVQRVVEKPPDEREKLKAAELLGKRYALFTEKIEGDIDGKQHITVDYGDG